MAKKVKKVYKYRNGHETKYSGFKVSGYQKRGKKAKGHGLKRFGY